MDDITWDAYVTNLGVWVFCVSLGPEPTWAVMVMMVVAAPFTYHLAKDMA